MSLKREILIFNRIFLSKLKIQKSKLEIKTQNYGRNIFLSKLEILVKSRNIGQNSKFLSELEILTKSRNFLSKL